MCGITGKFDYNNKVSESLISKMTDTLVHRGPDDKGVWCNDNFGFGMRRLSIIDIEGGHQPIFTNDKKIGIVFNGEIYNYKEIRKELIQKGVEFKTNSDTETILKGYEVCGDEIFEKLNGMFAIAIWNKNNKELTLVRDRIGIKPLYYYKDDSRLLFGSEIKAILADKTVPREVNQIGLSFYFDLMYIPNPHSAFQNIYKLEPGHILKVSQKNIEKKKYWDFEPSKIQVVNSKQDLKEEFLHLFEDSVKKRMLSEVPLGAFLSGGIDSSSIVAMMSKNSSERIKTYSIGFEDKQFDESNYAKQISEKFNTNHTNMYVDSSMLNWIENYVYHFDEPFADYAAFPTYIVSKLARKDLTVVLTGDGGDEIFAGYYRYNSEKIADNIKILPSFIRDGILSPTLKMLLSVLSTDSRHFNKIDSIIKRLSEVDKEKIRRYTERFKKYSDDDFRKYLKFKKRNIGMVEYYIELSSNIKSRLYFDQNTSLNEDMLTKVDRVTMANSLEARVPYLDHRIVEFSYKIPDKLLFKGYNLKTFLKLAYKDILPDNILNRPKGGFGFPIDKWIRYDLKELVSDTLLSKDSLINPFLNSQNIEKLVKSHYKKETNSGAKIFMLMVFNMWYKRWISQ